MTAFDFSQGPERAGSDSIKWRRYAGRDVIPMWVADMDFAAPPPVLDALKARLEHGVFGYADPWPALRAGHEPPGAAAGSKPVAAFSCFQTWRKQRPQTER